MQFITNNAEVIILGLLLFIVLIIAFAIFIKLDKKHGLDALKTKPLKITWEIEGLEIKFKSYYEAKTYCLDNKIPLEKIKQKGE